MTALLLATLALAPADVALDTAVACYEALDYTCAEERLAEALAGGLEAAARQKARLYQALVALAFRDEVRARAAVRALLEVDPAYDPGPTAPARLRELVEQERPAPPAPPRLLARLDVTTLRVFGADAERWTEGLGVEGAAGVLLGDRWALELTGGYSDHRPRTFTLEGLGLLTLTAQASWRGAVGPVQVAAGLGAGAARAAIDGVTGDQRYWGTLLQVPLEVVWPVWAGLGVGVRVAPSVLLVEDGGRAAASWLLPLMAGLRYAP